METIIKTQYVYVNSMKRHVGETTSSLTVAIPPGAISCNEDSEYLKIQVINFQLPYKWPWMNYTNNTFRISTNNGTTWTNMTVPVATYLSFGAMVRAMNNAIASAGLTGCGVTYDSNANRCTAVVPATTYIFNPMLIAVVIGFNYQQYTGALTYTSQYQCSPSSTTMLNLAVDGVTSVAQNHCTVTSTTTEPVSYLVSLPLQLTAPGDIITYSTNSTDIFFLKIQEKNITYLTLSLRDENDAIFTLADSDTLSEYNAVIRVDTVRQDNSQSELLRAIDSVVDYLRLIFVGAHLTP